MMDNCILQHGAFCINCFAPLAPPRGERPGVRGFALAVQPLTPRPPLPKMGRGGGILNVCILYLVCILALNPIANAQSVAPTSTTTTVKVERGITGIHRFTHLGKPLKAKPQRDAESPIGIRLSTSVSDSHQYEARFLGNKEGVYDLRALMEHVDGSEPSDVPAMSVEIVSTLPKDQRSDLFESATFKPKVWGGYRLSLYLLGLLWLSVPIIYFIRRSMRPKAVAVVPVLQSQPTIADQLRPLVEAAAAKTLTVRDKGRLELLLLHYWRERISLQSLDMATAIGRLREHPEAGQLISTVERWLHQSEFDADYPSHSHDSILELLKPYQGYAVTEQMPSLSTVGGAAK